MEFLKKFFNDEGTIIGLSGFNLEKPYYSKNAFTPPTFNNPFQSEKVFETKYNENVLLSL